jgi:acyl carrier protein
MNSERSSGVATVMFTDVEASTDLTTRLGDDAADALFTAHHGIVRDLIAAHGGRNVESTGDGFNAIRDHLADELELDPARVTEATRFKEDLDADSLDLYTLVQELEDSYGVKMSDEEAARITTVGQAADFVVARAPSVS